MGHVIKDQKILRVQFRVLVERLFGRRPAERGRFEKAGSRRDARLRPERNRTAEAPRFGVIASSSPRHRHQDWRNRSPQRTPTPIRGRKRSVVRKLPCPPSAGERNARAVRRTRAQVAGIDRLRGDCQWSARGAVRLRGRSHGLRRERHRHGRRSRPVEVGPRIHLNGDAIGARRKSLNCLSMADDGLADVRRVQVARVESARVWSRRGPRRRHAATESRGPRGPRASPQSRRPSTRSRRTSGGGDVGDILRLPDRQRLCAGPPRRDGVAVSAAPTARRRESRHGDAVQVLGPPRSARPN